MKAGHLAIVLPDPQAPNNVKQNARVQLWRSAHLLDVDFRSIHAGTLVAVLGTDSDGAFCFVVCSPSLWVGYVSKSQLKPV